MPKTQVTVTILGDSTLKRRLLELGQQTGIILREAVMAGAEVVRDDMKRRAPYRTGRLRSSIEARVRRSGTTRAGARIGPTDDVFYARYLEFGHTVKRGKRKVGHVPARPFVRPALDENEGKVRDTVAEVLRVALRRVSER